MKYLTHIIFIAALAMSFISCDRPSKSWDTMYSEQQELFIQNRNTFDQSLNSVHINNNVDTFLRVEDTLLAIPDSLVTRLHQIGIAIISIHSQSGCASKEVTFIPDSLWNIENFHQVQIVNSKCDERGRKGYHWKAEYSEHKHSLGQGEGWFIYSDSDLL